METNGEASLPTPEQARAALADTDDVRVSVEALSATPWPTWFVATITAMFVVLPITFGGALAEPDWLMPQGAWLAVMLGAEAVFLAFFVVAGRNWRAKTGVALRLDVLPKRATVPALVGTPLLIVGSGYAFRYTDQPLWLFAASAAGAALSIGFHLWFVRLHRKAS
ncbi:MULTISPECIES: hypothetical protein [Actinomadura]|uniref:Uncharacterized protein n=1 Tax=Actinomadura madurae TaxID=1993 RepID=A0A1I5VHG4_9ACTN|nr:hypothetical protein [Actinomadura madurae]MCP9952261.1 hypothetical protein [Actinomadura madurae]MCP9969025.1 hypothetical protein [Actinomadura madurae]MCP9981494.1 hypothetical protein [Actinomadura madurae]MCQ0006993.1 hypothetical protein [Actinomadura madurae]MCQ0017697.1 hypothetical protein [Actinomadura madurae]